MQFQPLSSCPGVTKDTATDGIRARRLGRRGLGASIARLRLLPIVCPGKIDDLQVMSLARSHQLTAYDASYLALAIREGCALVSLDRRLTGSAAAEGVPAFS